MVGLLRGGGDFEHHQPAMTASLLKRFCRTSRTLPQRVEKEVARLAAARGERQPPEHVGRTAAEQRILESNSGAWALAFQPQRPQLVARPRQRIADEGAEQQPRPADRLVVGSGKVPELTALVGCRDPGHRDPFAGTQEVVKS